MAIQLRLDMAGKPEHMGPGDRKTGHKLVVGITRFARSREYCLVCHGPGGYQPNAIHLKSRAFPDIVELHGERFT